jgi:hypothetical protein
MIRLTSLQSVGYIDVKIKVLFYDHSAGVTYTTEEIEMRMVTGVYAVDKMVNFKSIIITK